MKKIIALAMAMAVLFGMAAGEKVPSSISYQGRLTNASGVPLSGNFNMIFRIYDDSDGVNMTWEETHNVDINSDGTFIVKLGTISPLPGLQKVGGLKKTTEMVEWLEVNVNATGAPIRPRVRLISSPFALAAYGLAGDVSTIPGHIAVFPGPTPISDCTYVPLEIGVNDLVSQIDMRPPFPPVNDCTAYVPIQLKVSDNLATIRLKNPSAVSDCAYVPMSMSVDASLAQIRMRPPTPVSDCAYVPLRFFSNATESNISLKPPNPTMGGSLEMSTGAAGSGPSLKIVNDGPPNRQVGEQMQIAMVQAHGMPIIEEPLLTLNATPSSGASLVMLNPQPLPPNAAEAWLSLSTDMTMGASMLMFDPQPEPPGFTKAPTLQLNGGTATEGSSLVMRHSSAVGSSDDIVMMAGSNGGRVGINTPSPAEALHVVGNICATGTIGACSDERYKKNVETISNALALIEKIRGVNFNWRTKEFPDMKFSSEEQVGFIAQEINKVLPEVVSQGSDGYYSVDYGRLTPVLVEAVKEQQKEITSLKTEMQELKRLVQSLATTGTEKKVEVAVSDLHK